MGNKGNDSITWEEAERIWKNRPKRTADAVGKRCATDGCTRTSGITFEKPLCYPCWLTFDHFAIHECDKCHWFDDVENMYDTAQYNHPLRDRFETLCSDCAHGRDVPVYAHGPVEHQTRYLYILKLDGGKYYIGQTNDLELRLQEHRDGLTQSTKGKNPKLVFFDERKGNKEDLNEEENVLTQINARNPRAIRRIVNDWQRLMRLVEIEVGRPSQSALGRWTHQVLQP